MIFVPKWNKRIKWRIIDESFYKLLDTSNRMTDSNAESNWMVPKAKKLAETEISINNRWQIEQKVMVLETSKTND